MVVIQNPLKTYKKYSKIGEKREKKQLAACKMGELGLVLRLKGNGSVGGKKWLGARGSGTENDSRAAWDD